MTLTLILLRCATALVVQRNCEIVLLLSHVRQFLNLYNICQIYICVPISELSAWINMCVYQKYHQKIINILKAGALLLSISQKMMIDLQLCDYEWCSGVFVKLLRVITRALKINTTLQCLGNNRGNVMMLIPAIRYRWFFWFTCFKGWNYLSQCVISNYPAGALIERTQIPTLFHLWLHLM